MEWRIRKPVYPVEHYKGLSKTLSYLLSVRGISPDEASRFLKPKLSYLYSPFAFKDMERAVKRIILARKWGEKVFIHGDYDVDGITALSLLYRGLKRLGIRVYPFIPNRFNEGYGLSMNGVERAAKIGCSLIITVDCGITSVNEVKYARQLGIDVIITDHHEPEEELPPAFAILNPKADQHYPFKELAGVGVAFKLLEGLYEALSLDKTELFWDLDLVALGTVADLVPLLDENRVLVKSGLSILAKSKKAGIKALKSVAGLGRMEQLDTFHIGFILGPRLNAAGRMEDPMKAFKLLITTDGNEALKRAGELNSLNQKRQRVQQEIFESALEQLESEGWKELPIIVLYNEEWHEGVIGIVASKLVEYTLKPVILLTKSGEVIKGSARGVGDFNIFEAIFSQKDLLLNFGGHKLAAGLVMERDKIDRFKAGVIEFAARWQKQNQVLKELFIDMVIPEGGYNREELTESFQLLAPFGMANPKPVFVYQGVKLKGPLVGIRRGMFKLSMELKGFREESVFVNSNTEIEKFLNTHSDVAFTLYRRENILIIDVQ